MHHSVILCNSVSSIGENDFVLCESLSTINVDNLMRRAYDTAMIHSGGRCDFPWYYCIDNIKLFKL